MWVFTEIGFFSAVAATETGDPTLVMVRARVKKDLERLAQKIDDTTELDAPEILQWKGRDYPYRVIIPREIWADVLWAIAEDIEYGNFKNRVKAVDGYERSSMYGRIWSVMYDAEKALKKVTKKFSSTGYKAHEELFTTCPTCKSTSGFAKEDTHCYHCGEPRKTAKKTPRKRSSKRGRA